MSFLTTELVPPEYHKYFYATAGAIVGGVVFGMTGSWSLAITWDIIAAVSCWIGVKFAESFGGAILRFVSFFVTWK